MATCPESMSPHALLYAHTRPGAPPNEWELLSAHASAVADRAATFANRFGMAEIARAVGVLHDAGKASAEFQAYLHGLGSSVDHSTYGARLAAEFGAPFGPMLAACIAGHHAGLADGEGLRRRLTEARVPDASGWVHHISRPNQALLRPARAIKPLEGRQSFTQSFLARMVFSCLVDADFVETEAFISGERIERGITADVSALRDRLAAYMQNLGNRATASLLNALRIEVLEHATRKAEMLPGLFTLTVPTGGGKTLTSLSFALSHAVRHGKRRIIYVIPYMSIIEQTAAVFRHALGADVVLEHHSTFDWEEAAGRAAGRDGGDERDGLGILRRAAENWEAPVVVTTAVQFFQSLFANRTSACRKLHNIADSVVILDEAQTLPQPFLLPCLAALEELVHNYGVSVVLCTATQPALRCQDGALQDRTGRSLGLDIPDERELAPRPPALEMALRRTTATVLPDPVTDQMIAERFAAVPRMMCIVNSRGHARALFDRIVGLDGAVHLTTLMCPVHRRSVLAGIRKRLDDGLPVRLVATSLVEAGVDISFPEVWRALTGIDSLKQAAGRCNREGELLPDLGKIVVFRPAEDKMPRAMRVFCQAAESVLRNHAHDPLSSEAVAAYFRELWFEKGTDALDAAVIEGFQGRGILQALRESARDWRFPFESIARAFRLIDDMMLPVVVPWDQDAQDALRVVAAAERVPAAELRKLRQYTVGIPKAARDEWLTAGALLRVRRDFGDALLRFSDLAHYRRDTGMDLAEPRWRRPEDNVM